MTGRSTRDPAAERLVLEPSPTSPGRARRLIRERAAAWSLPEAVAERLELVGIELSAAGATAPPTASRLAGLVDRLYRQFRSQRDGHRETVAAALARGERTVELQAGVSPAAVPAARAYVELLEEADELCRTGELLTPPPPAHVRSLRRWFVDQMAAQLQDEAPPG